MQAPYLNNDFFKLVHKHKDTLKPVIFFAEYENKKLRARSAFKVKIHFMGGTGAHLII